MGIRVWFPRGYPFGGGLVPLGVPFLVAVWTLLVVVWCFLGYPFGGGLVPLGYLFGGGLVSWGTLWWRFGASRGTPLVAVWCRSEGYFGTKLVQRWYHLGV